MGGASGFLDGCCFTSFLCLVMRETRRSTRFPYTTLFRSEDVRAYARDQLITSRMLLAVVGAVTRAHVEQHARRDELRSEEHTSELQSPDHLVYRPLLQKKNWNHRKISPNIRRLARRPQPT